MDPRVGQAKTDSGDARLIMQGPTSSSRARFGVGVFALIIVLGLTALAVFAAG